MTKTAIACLLSDMEGWIFRNTAIGLVIEATDWEHNKAGAWLDVQVVNGRVQKSLRMMCRGIENPSMYLRADLEQALATTADQVNKGGRQTVVPPDKLMDILLDLSAWLAAETGDPGKPGPVATKLRELLDQRGYEDALGKTRLYHYANMVLAKHRKALSRR